MNMSDSESTIETGISAINLSEAGPDIIEVDPALLDGVLLPSRNSEESFIWNKSSITCMTAGREKDFSVEKEVTNPAIQILGRLISLRPSSPKKSVDTISPLKNFLSDRIISETSEKDLKSPPKLQSSSEESALETELSKLYDLLINQEKASREKISEYETRLTQLTGQTCAFQNQLKLAEEREKALVKKVNDQNQSQVQLSIVMQEYEKLISKLTAEIETEKKQNREKIENLTAEKDSALVHLTNVEAAFTDVHQKYEKCKKVIEDYKKNEGKMKSLITDQTESLKIKEKQLESIQAHASKHLENAQVEVERSKQIHEQEMTGLRALLRKTELKVISLQESLEQKIKENQELTTICDELIEGKVPRR